MYFLLAAQPGAYPSISISNAYTLTIDKDYFYFSGPAGKIKFLREEFQWMGLRDIARGEVYK
jgi:hypothetical protein